MPVAPHNYERGKCLMGDSHGVLARMYDGDPFYKIAIISWLVDVVATSAYSAYVSLCIQPPESRIMQFLDSYNLPSDRQQ